MPKMKAYQESIETMYIVKWKSEGGLKTIRIAEADLADGFFKEKMLEGKKPKMFVEERITRIRQLTQ